jgi:hypothetical protein
MEHLTDAYLLPLIQVQRKIEAIRDMLYIDDTGLTSELTISLVMGGISSLEKELQILEDSLPPAAGVARMSPCLYSQNAGENTNDEIFRVVALVIPISKDISPKDLSRRSPIPTVVVRQ